MQHHNVIKIEAFFSGNYKKKLKKDNKIDLKEMTLKPNLVFNWVIFLGDFSVQY